MPGPITEGLRPKIRETSRNLYWIYFTLTCLCGLCLLATGMDWFDALCVSLATVSSGGFSATNAGVPGFDSTAVNVILIVFMVIAACNFGLFYLALHGGLNKVLRRRELWALVAILLGSWLIVTLNLHLTYLGHPLALPEDIRSHHRELGSSLHHALFQVASAYSSLGYITEDYNLYPNLSRCLLIALMFCGGMAGSAAGGIKTIRVLILVKVALRAVRQAFHPQEVKAIKLGGRTIDEDTVGSILVLFALWIAIGGAGTLVMTSVTPDLGTAFSAVLACMANVGTGLAGLGPTESWGWLPSWSKLLLCMLMILGRLELLTFLVLFVPRFWRR